MVWSKHKSVSVITLVMEDYQEAIMCSHTCHVTDFLVSVHLQDMSYINVMSAVLFLKTKHIMFSKGHFLKK